jgi:hypothetical protein
MTNNGLLIVIILCINEYHAYGRKIVNSLCVSTMQSEKESPTV